MSTAPLAPAWRGLVDDASTFPPAETPLEEAAAAHAARRRHPHGDLVGTFVVRDSDIPALKATPLALSVVLTGGAAQVAGPAALCRKLHVALEGVEAAVRDLDDPAGNVRRISAAVDAARGEGQLDDHVPVYVELPVAAPEHAWLAAADEVAAADFRLKIRTGGLDAGLFPTADTLARLVDAALDRETPFKCTAGLHRAVRHTGEDGFEHHGFLNLLLATRIAFDGAPAPEVREILDRRDAAGLAEEARALDLAGARRWFTSFGSCSVEEPLQDLLDLGLLED